MTSNPKPIQRRLRVVFDTNVVVSAIVSANGTPARLLVAGLMGRFDLVLSDHILEETERTLKKPYFMARLSGEDRNGILEFLRSEATIVPITVEVHGIAPSRDDDLVLATAVNAGARYLVTGDIALRAVERYQSVEIISASDFLSIIT